jgi:squalene-associated FAD-dependent desaturase
LSPKIVVVGGGYAGISAATALVEEGLSVDLLETRSSLGGRVYSTAASENFPVPVDNGPHLLMGCYRETFRFFKRIGSSSGFHWMDPLSLSWQSAGGTIASLNCADLPAPFHLVFGLLASNAFPFSEKIRMALALRRFHHHPFSFPESVETVEDFLNFTRQGPRTRERFWVPLCRAVMNVPPDVAPIEGLGQVLQRIFFGTRRDSALVVPARPLSEIAFPETMEFLKSKGGLVHFRDGVLELSLTSGPFQVKTASGKVFTGDALVLAVPPRSLEALWTTSGLPSPVDASRLGKSPIVSVHLILERPLMTGHLIGLPGANFDWIFNRNANWGYAGPGQYLSLVCSGNLTLAQKHNQEILESALKELHRHFPNAVKTQCLYSKVTKEMAATFLWNRETGPFRPPGETTFSNIFLAGDFTATGLPATIEGACQSGHQAAEKVRDYLEKKA